MNFARIKKQKRWIMFIKKAKSKDNDRMRDSMEITNKRIEWIDSLKLFAIFLVVWGHSMHLGWIREDYFTGVDGLIYSFHMPLFMILSGFLSYKLSNGDFDWKKRFVNLIVPCITFGLFCFVIGIVNLNFWFLKSLFICYVLVGVYTKCKMKGKFIILLAFCLLLFPLLVHIPLLGAYKVDFMLPCFAFGIILRKKFEWFKQHSPIIAAVSFVIFVIGCCYWTKDCVWYATKPNWIDYKDMIINHKLVFHPISLWQNLFRYIVGMAGSLTFISLFYIFSMINLCGKFTSQISKWGKYTLEVYLLQSFFVECNWFGVPMPVDNNLLYCYVYTPLFSIIIVAVCIFVAYWLEKNRYFAFWLFGRPYNNNQ